MKAVVVKKHPIRVEYVSRFSVLVRRKVLSRLASSSNLPPHRTQKQGCKLRGRSIRQASKKFSRDSLGADSAPDIKADKPRITGCKGPAQGLRDQESIPDYLMLTLAVAISDCQHGDERLPMTTTSPKHLRLPRVVKDEQEPPQPQPNCSQLGCRKATALQSGRASRHEYISIAMRKHDEPDACSNTRTCLNHQSLLPRREDEL
jgi:hypothetical protein